MRPFQPRSRPFGNGKALSSDYTAAGALSRVAKKAHMYSRHEAAVPSVLIRAEEEELVFRIGPPAAAEIDLTQLGPC